jgi:hypothetical protein
MKTILTATILLALASTAQASLPTGLNGLGVSIDYYYVFQPGDFDLIANAGLKIARTNLTWEVCERTAGNYRFDGYLPNGQYDARYDYDRFYSGFKNRGVTPLLILDPSNSALYGTDTSTQAFRDGFARYAAAAAEHFKNMGGGVVWEMCNEPNEDIFWPGTGTSATNYMNMLKQAVPAMRAKDSGAMIVGPSVSRTWGSNVPTYLNTCFSQGLMNYVDAVDVHGYGVGTPEENVSNYANIRSLMGAYHSTPLPPLSCSEWGYAAASDARTEQQKADTMARAFLVNMSQGVSLTAWYQWAGGENNRSYGLVPAYSRDPLPAYYAAQNLTRSLKGETFFQKLDDGNSADWLLVFKKNPTDRGTLAAWTTGDPRNNVAVPGWGTLNLTSTPFYVNPVPEPSAIALLGTGLAGVLAYAWRKRQTEVSSTVNRQTMSYGKCLAGIAIVLFVLSSGLAIRSASGAVDGDRMLTTSVRSILANSAAWSVITTLNDGSLGLVYQKAAPVEQTIGGANVSMEWIRSTNGGLSWSSPITVAERLGSGGQLYDTRPGGGYIVYEQRNQSMGQMANGRIVCAMTNLDYQYDSQGNNLDGFMYAGLTYTYSDNLGATWQPLISMPTTGPFSTAYANYGAATQGRIITLPDDSNTALMSIYGLRNPAYNGPVDIPTGTTYMAGVLRSTDNGLTWGDPSLVMTKSTNEGAYEETNLCRVSDNRMLAEMRTPADTVVQYVSTDQGRTWQKGDAVTEPGQIPGSAFQLADGKLMLTWGNRRSPYGAMAMISNNGGRTWDYEHRVSLAGDASGGSCGYAYGAQAKDGSIVVTYYDLPAGGADWSTGKVYGVRFTEKEFLDAAGLPDRPTLPGFIWDGSGDPIAHGFKITPTGGAPFRFDTQSGLAKPGVAYQNTTASDSMTGCYETTADLRNANGWKVEARVQVLQNTGDHFGLWFSAEDDVGGVSALLCPNKIEWFNGNYDTYVASSLNDGALLTTAIGAGYHLLGITLAPNATAAHVWVDGIDRGIIALTANAYYGRVIFGDGSGDSGAVANWDYVNVNYLVPEPSAIVSLFTGVVAMLYYAWRKRKSWSMVTPH